MAYAAVGSLQLTIERLLNTSNISIVQNSSPKAIDLLYKEVRSLRGVLRSEFDKRRSTINMKMVKSLETEITEAVYRFEDVIDSHLSDQFLLQSEEIHPLSISVDLQELEQDIDSFIEMVHDMKKAYIHELRNPSEEEEEEEEEEEGSRSDYGGYESKMVGLSDLFMMIIQYQFLPQYEKMIVSLVGMAGIGKTTLAIKLFQDPFSASHYNTHVSVTIGPKFRLPDILVDILTQVNPDIDEIMLMDGEKVLGELKEMVYGGLKDLRYFILLDDVWDQELCYELTELFPDNKNGSLVLITTRLQEVAECADPLTIFKIPFLNEKESWDLLRKKVFDEEESFCYELVRAGKKIAKNCEGLPLTIVTVGEILSKADKTIAYWNEVADDKQHSVYKDAYDQMSNQLYPSYDYLEQHLKACLLYGGAFPQNYAMPLEYLINLWSVEGFLDSEPVSYTNNAIFAIDRPFYYLIELCSKNVIMYDEEVCCYRLHSSFWYMCNKEAASNKFFYAFNCLDDALLEEDLNYQRRLCIRNNVLLAIEDVHSSIASALKVRSLLCTGPYHHYPVPLCLDDLTLLRVLHTLSIRFFEFPMEVVKLVQLRYLSLTYDKKLPTSISKLFNLEYLNVDRHQSIIQSDGNPSYLPSEIWNMKELKSLQALGRDLPHPCREGSLLPNLLQLNGVSPQSCTKDVFEKIPNLEVLQIKIELGPDASEPLSCFDHISHLNKLKTLACAIVNPVFKTGVVTPLAPLSLLPSSLTLLTLSGLGYPWEEISKISSLPNLENLKLHSYAFRGPEWEVRDTEFQRLQFLDIEDTDLERWTFHDSSSCFHAIQSLSIKHCYKLKEIPVTFGTSLQSVELVAVSCEEKFKKDWEDKYGDQERSVLVIVSYVQ
ncbi:hypothetical protein MIMGU_mgv1a023037mg [Erythranthe guttata]|uniref:Uncharacterized protein n=1 Tax=Erythranthe guttata TaxID=4155 RepID=A0A022PTV6_ERYGU|nr:PREDICTED: putative late blight resistance protein homolog R1A-10 [Erythranthe guttata]EYU17685.1 hypothetical protein MIMGU_mgv1a023037mg [Erythranthe guttata]|eukprot:XP_012829188.1 PREDICTED: putative late blight resistance protein homolog R1A-10 [Erythranthe guttata]